MKVGDPRNQPAFEESGQHRDHERTFVVACARALERPHELGQRSLDHAKERLAVSAQRDVARAALKEWRTHEVLQHLDLGADCRGGNV